MSNVKNVAIAGGVASNKYFRSEIKKLENELKIKSYFPKKVLRFKRMQNSIRFASPHQPTANQQPADNQQQPATSIQ